MRKLLFFLVFITQKSFAYELFLCPKPGETPLPKSWQPLPSELVEETFIENWPHITKIINNFKEPMYVTNMSFVLSVPDNGVEMINFAASNKERSHGITPADKAYKWQEDNKQPFYLVCMYSGEKEDGELVMTALYRGIPYVKKK